MSDKLPLPVRIHRRINGPFRRARWATFAERMVPLESDRILDVGGTPGSWIMSELEGLNVTLLNQWAFKVLPSKEECGIEFQSQQGDGCRLNFKEGEFEMAYSNSMIEHLRRYPRNDRDSDFNV